MEKLKKKKKRHILQLCHTDIFKNFQIKVHTLIIFSPPTWNKWMIKIVVCD